MYKTTEGNVSHNANYPTSEPPYILICKLQDDMSLMTNNKLVVLPYLVIKEKFDNINSFKELILFWLQTSLRESDLFIVALKLRKRKSQVCSVH